MRPPELARRAAWPLLIFCLPGAACMAVTILTNEGPETPLGVGASWMLASGMLIAGLAGLCMLWSPRTGRKVLLAAAGCLAAAVAVALCTPDEDALPLVVLALVPLLFVALCIVALRGVSTATVHSEPEMWLP